MKNCKIIWQILKQWYSKNQTLKMNKKLKRFDCYWNYLKNKIFYRQKDKISKIKSQNLEFIEAMGKLWKLKQQIVNLKFYLEK